MDDAVDGLSFRGALPPALLHERFLGWIGTSTSEPSDDEPAGHICHEDTGEP